MLVWTQEASQSEGDVGDNKLSSFISVRLSQKQPCLKKPTMLDAHVLVWTREASQSEGDVGDNKLSSFISVRLSQKESS